MLVKNCTTGLWTLPAIVLSAGLRVEDWIHGLYILDVDLNVSQPEFHVGDSMFWM